MNESIKWTKNPPPVFHVRPGGAYTVTTKAAKAARDAYGKIADGEIGLSRADLCAEELMATRGSQRWCGSCGSIRCKMKAMFTKRRGDWIGRTEALRRRKRKDHTEKIIIGMFLFMVIAFLAGLAFDDHPNGGLIDWIGIFIFP